jgi:predicted sulfurtransferase
MASKAFGLVQGESDPISYTCTCGAGEKGGSVLLFYRYWSNYPKLPPELRDSACDAEALADWHRELTAKYSLGGKIRIAREGFNITVAGTRGEIESYINECCDHWSFSGISLDTEYSKNEFFKPSEGCACVFNKVASVRVAAEITPMGVEGYLPQKWDNIESLSPSEFHQRCHQEHIVLLDVRNHYESKIGYFIDPHSGEAAIRPPIRRFSQWPQYVKHNANAFNGEGGKQIMTYCTGGIRCEKAVRWMQEDTQASQGINSKVCTLKGGISAYLSWMESEIASGQKQPSDSLFKGRNYVFDARGSIGLPQTGDQPPEPISQCHYCTRPSGQLSKCRSKGCHLVLVVCLDCNEEDVRCCVSCQHMDDSAALGGLKVGPRGICECEREREMLLWGGEHIKRRGRRKAKKIASTGGSNVEVHDPVLS